MMCKLSLNALQPEWSLRWLNTVPYTVFHHIIHIAYPFIIGSMQLPSGQQLTILPNFLFLPNFFLFILFQSMKCYYLYQRFWN